ncbi:altronate dehydratase family protein [Rhodopirellula sp. JC740]|uniref:Altronate dehydratase family protein n=1 Tax=Rhodopirellula halodulae TaxID=2894198 RepID=A0ABS8NJ31_9BACT|nr:altronate dehydratase family protein [Rhodopirellula sp. JC740]MCC9643570.1 altronate dehydratase family protein [Rhodopirellula sp. JC740]
MVAARKIPTTTALLMTGPEGKANPNPAVDSIVDNAGVAKSHVVRLHELDNVWMTAGPLQPHQNVGEFTVGEASIPAGHKVACRPIAAGEMVTKFGQPIGKASRKIDVGEHVHSANLVDAHEVDSDWRTLVGTAFPGGVPELPPVPKPNKTWIGFVRPDGQVGTRNFVQILARVNCSATVCHHVAARFPPERLAEFPNVDGIAIGTHTTGCALRYAGLKQQMLGRVLKGYAGHANVGACLTIGLGCEQTTPEYLREHHQLVEITDPRKLPVAASDSGFTSTTMLTMQAEGGTRATIDRAEKHLETMLDIANQNSRTEVPAHHLRLALECGGSDGHSGWTANPLVGALADRMVAHGGAAVLSETTELIGAEHLLVARSRDESVAGRLMDKVDWWKQHVAMYGGEIDNNPSIGNKAGGLTTITEKSLGAVSKSGSGVLDGVLDYAAPVPARGLYVMDSPGFDPSSVTGKVAGGCNLVLFTTGRGSCFGHKPVPVIKIASNSMLFHALRDDMDWNAGQLLEGVTMDALADQLFDELLRVASGKQTASERLGLGDHEFVPWTVGPVL